MSVLRCLFRLEAKSDDQQVELITKIKPTGTGSPVSLDLSVFEGFGSAPTVCSQEVLRHDVVIVAELFLVTQVPQLRSLPVFKEG